MEERVVSFQEEAGLLTGAVLIATLGGLANWLRKARNKNWRTFLGAIVTAAFTGIMSHTLTGWLDLDVHLQFAISGAAGYSGGILLDTLTPALLHLVHHRVGGKTEK